MMRRPRDPSTYNTTGLKRGGSPGRKPGAENKATIERELRAEIAAARYGRLEKILQRAKP
jgi:hypothetical protein